MAKKEEKFEDKSIIIEDSIEDIMHASMMPYSEHVILDRALPRVEDGLKPVQRRILFAMSELGNTPDKPHKKSARIVGECLGKYHPHGDSSVYDAMVRLAQPFNTRMLLIDGHGNFGSVDGDSAAAMRYTEARLTPLAMEMLRDIDKETVSFSLNFDDTLQEPDMLPCKFPNLLVNGAMGIAVGLTTNIPPHNLGEVIDGIVAYIENSRITLKEMMKYIPAPDFPTGGVIIDGEGIEQAYATGKGRIVVRARAYVEKDGDKEMIVITELPYQKNKAQLLQKINELREKKKEVFGGITDIVDESDRNGQRSVIKLRKGVDGEKTLAALFKTTGLEDVFSVNMVAIAGGKPRQMGLLEIIAHYTEYQRQIIYRRSQFELNQAKRQEHIQQGKLIAVNNIRRVVDIILNAETDNEAKEQIKREFSLTERQAVAILEMKLKQLKKVDARKLEEEIAELGKRIEELESVLSSKRRQLSVVKKELLEIKRKYSDKRRSEIVSPDKVAIATIDPNAKIERSGVLVLTQGGYLKFMGEKNYRLASKSVVNCSSADLVRQVLKCDNSANLIGFTRKGLAVVFSVDSLGDDKWKSKGLPISKIAKADSDDRVLFVATPAMLEGKELCFFTRDGMVKKSEASEYGMEKKSAYPALVFKNDGDEVVNVEIVDPENEFLLFVTEQGMVLNAESDIPQQGRKASGVRGIQLAEGDKVIYAASHSNVGEIVVMNEGGVAKRVVVSSIEPTMRYRKGVQLSDVSKSGAIVFVDMVTMPYDFAIELVDGSCVPVNTEDVPIVDRTKKGVNVLKDACKNNGSNLDMVAVSVKRHNID